ncbi:3-hydroxyacyl-CoA dehydrogenase NAD-binding domain-containing protein [Streptomyces sp. 7-21]|uniref:3-hydroxyacyl-CoA dehydrogenase NAD-binding domain-containing protein n=1 Tax=Streptomyces sp. 7-21 TaxID=2802283 RepID=UPI00191FEA96|nr:3-hydroxyacyl-CoA dehydrogenase NAD-binding domain-containing protein [Streptomyces sp. 7-21]MBL1069028.1 3-hydroxyacyl-CoA dehydrogenase [Streptomyces sp. 7-21]
MPHTPPAALTWHRDDDGLVTLTCDGPAWTRPDAPAAGSGIAAALADAADRLAAGAGDGTVRGAVLRVPGARFHAAAGLDEVLADGPGRADRFLAASRRVHRALRRLETLGLPVVAVVTGPAHDGGLELALACHHRIAVDRPGVTLGLPGVTLGLTPSGGGVVRTVRLLGVASALNDVLLPGTRHRPGEAARLGLVDATAPTEEDALALARDFIDGHRDAVQPWDAPGYRIPGGTPADPELAAALPSFPALLRARTGGAPAPAPQALLAAAVECSQVGVEAAADVEARYAAEVATGRIAANLTRAFHVDIPRAREGVSRPAGPEHVPASVAVLGAGMMGAGIAAACASAGLRVVLTDVSEEAARRGLERVAATFDRAVARGRLTAGERREALARVTPAARLADAAGCEAVIEAVTEDLALKQEVFAEVQHVAAPGALLATNTSTLPVSTIAGSVGRPEDLLGLHFFSPVDRMPLVEIVRGRRTSDATLARGIDLVRRLRKTPVVVRDARGFFTSAVIGRRLDEGVAMLAEGIAPASVEQAARQAGYPTGVLALLDEISLTLVQRIRAEARAGAEAAGRAWQPHPAEAVLDRMTGEFKRPGRAAGAGFYDYDADGRRTGLWPGLREHFGRDGAGDVPLRDLTERLLFAETLQALRLLADGVVASRADATAGALLGLSFPAWTGGPVQYAENYEGGLPGFAARAEELAARYGERFAPPPSLLSGAPA